MKIMTSDENTLLCTNVFMIRMEGLTHYIYWGIWLHWAPDTLLSGSFYPRYFTTLRCSGHSNYSNYTWAMCLPDYPFQFPGKNGTNAMNILTSFLFAPTYSLTPNSNSFLYKSKKISLFPVSSLLLSYRLNMVPIHCWEAIQFESSLICHWNMKKIFLSTFC